MHDLISRQEAIKEAERIIGERASFKAYAIVDMLRKMEPKREAGHWIILSVMPFDGEDVKCSECGHAGCSPNWNYCPNCGVKIEGVENE